MSASSGIDIQEEPLVDSDKNFEAPVWAMRRRTAASTVREFFTTNTGLLLVVLSQAFSSMMNTAVKRLSTVDPPASALQVILVRMVITYGCSLAYMIVTGVEDPVLGPKGVRLLLVLRGITGFAGLFGIYFSLQYLSLSDATVLTFLSPLCTAAAGAIFLKETFYVSHALAGVVSFVGVILIAQPPFLFEDSNMDGPVLTPMDALDKEEFAPMRMIAIGVSLVGVLGLTGAYITIRAIGKRAHALHIMGSFALQSIFTTTLGMAITKTPFIVPSTLEWFALLFMVGIFGFIGQVLLTMGLQREAAGRASIGLYTQILFATIFQLIFFHTYPSRLSIIGTFLILSSALYVALTKGNKAHTGTNQSSVPLGAEEYDLLEAAPPAPKPKLNNT